MEPQLIVEHVSKRYGANGPVLEDVNLSVEAGEFVALLGSNGSGKSTLLKCIVRLLAPTSGRIVVGGNELTALSGAALRDARRSVALISQQANLVRRRSALANVATGALGRHHDLASKFGSLAKDELLAAHRHLESVGVTHIAHQPARTLSGGQAQRVAIARGLAQNPALLLADEPVASLDPEAAEEICRLLRSLANAGLAILCVLHQPDLALRHAHRVVGLKRGRIDFDEGTDSISEYRVSSLYAA